MEICREWAIEVDPDRQSYNLEAQERFIVQFIGSLYNDVRVGHPELSKIQSLHFTRIFDPARDKMGAYVRLQVFAQEEKIESVEQEIDNRLAIAVEGKTVFQIRKRDLDWEEITENYGGRALAPVFRDYLDSISRTALELLRRKQQGLDIESVAWPWTHFFFNSVRGYGRSVVEFAQGAVTGFIPNV